MSATMTQYFDKIWAGYPTKRPDLGDNCGWVDSFCAVKLMTSFYSSGVVPNLIKEAEITSRFGPKVSSDVMWGSVCTVQNRHLIAGAEPLARLIRKLNIFGAPTIWNLNISKPEHVCDELENKRGVIFFHNYWQRRLNGKLETTPTGDHIDVLNFGLLGSRRKDTRTRLMSILERAEDVWLFE